MASTDDLNQLQINVTFKNTGLGVWVANLCKCCVWCAICFLPFIYMEKNDLINYSLSQNNLLRCQVLNSVWFGQYINGIGTEHLKKWTTFFIHLL